MRTALEAPRLPVHVLDHNVVDLAEAAAVFKHFPGLVRVEMDLDRLFVADGEQAVALEIFREVFRDLVLVEVFAIDEELRVVSEFKFFHDLYPFCPAPVRGYCAQYIRKARLSQVSKR